MAPMVFYQKEDEVDDEEMTPYPRTETPAPQEDVDIPTTPEDTRRIGEMTAALSLSPEEKKAAIGLHPKQSTIITRASSSNDEIRRETNDHLRSEIADGPFRRGKWTPEEEAYAARLIRDFDAGILPNLNDGATLRAFLSKKLNCSAMRISKKFAGEKCLGKQIYVRRQSDGSSSIDEDIEEEAHLLDRLEAAFLISVATPPASASSTRCSSSRNAMTRANERMTIQDTTTGSSSSSSSRSTHIVSDNSGEETESFGSNEHIDPSAPSKKSMRTNSGNRRFCGPNSSKKNYITKDVCIENPIAQHFIDQSPLQQWEDEERLRLQAEAADAEARLGIHSFFANNNSTDEVQETREEVDDVVGELYDTARRASAQRSTNFADLPKAECIQQPPAVLMLELGPTPRNHRQAHPTIGAYAFSIARGTSDSSLQRMGCSRVSLVDARGSIGADDFDSDAGGAADEEANDDDAACLEASLPNFFDEDDDQSNLESHTPSAQTLSFQPPTFVFGASQPYDQSLAESHQASLRNIEISNISL